VKNAARNNNNSPDYMDEADFNLRMNYYKKQVLSPPACLSPHLCHPA
jgi:hypothetical protein